MAATSPRDDQRPYRGRFAPSPTGPLHFGSLIAAIGSFLQARANDGVWLVRIEDLDPPREQRGAADQILFTLDALGLQWDEKVLYQSRRDEYYRAAFEELIDADHCYPCVCSRREILEANQGQTIDPDLGPRYTGRCRDGRARSAQTSVLRLKTTATPIRFTDRLQGEVCQRLEPESGDFVVRRKDGLTAYQLAVVVDDSLQGINEVVRGIDLLSQTPRQLHLQELLGYRRPDYAHLPIAINADGQKLSKQTGARGVTPRDYPELTFRALEFLNHAPPDELLGASPVELLDFAVRHWSLERLSTCPAKKIVGL